MGEIVGQPADEIDPAKKTAMEEDIAALRKSCEWLVTLGAANVIGNVLKLSANPALAVENASLRRATFVVIFVQMLFALIGALQYDHGEVDYSAVMTTLKRNRTRRYWLRNAALALLLLGFILLGAQNW